MTDWLQTVALALIQGVTEFLPVSSSAHLILPSLLWPQLTQRSILFDAALHGGTLVAVLLFFRRDLGQLLRACFVWDERRNQERRLVIMLCLGSLPVLVVGFFAAALVSILHNLPTIALATLVFGLLLWHAVWYAQRGGSSTNQQATESQQELPVNLSYLAALSIGLGQVTALIPGVSRAGVTITCGLWFGLTPQTAARFSFLLAIPVIAAAASYSFYQLLSQATVADHLGFENEWLHALGGALVAAIFAYLTIGFFLRLLNRAGMMPFVVYRLLLGGLLLIYWQAALIRPL